MLGGELVTLVEFNEWLNTFFKMGLGSVVIIIVKSTYTYIKKTYLREKERDQLVETEIGSLKKALLALEHDTLYKLANYYIERGYITVDELDNLRYIYESYTSLGGNSTGSYLYEKCLALPIRTSGDRQLDDMIKEKRGDSCE